MKRVLMVSVLALSGLVALSAQANNQNLAEAPVNVPAQPLPASGNTGLTGQIMQKLTDDPLLSKDTITANVGQNGQVSLNGVVSSDQLAQRAVKVVEAVPGVASVKSNILVNQDPFAPAPAPEDFNTPINQTPPPPPAAQEPQAILADALSKAPALNRVSGQVYGSQIGLIGTVSSQQAVRQAEQIAHQALPNYPIADYIWVDNSPLSQPALKPPANPGPGGGR